MAQKIKIKVKVPEREEKDPRFPRAFPDQIFTKILEMRKCPVPLPTGKVGASAGCSEKAFSEKNLLVPTSAADGGDVIYREAAAAVKASFP